MALPLRGVLSRDRGKPDRFPGIDATNAELLARFRAGALSWEIVR
jgi:hypothetical protein